MKIRVTSYKTPFIGQLFLTVLRKVAFQEAFNIGKSAFMTNTKKPRIFYRPLVFLNYP